MKKILAEIGIGLTSTFAGIYLMYLFLRSINSRADLIFLGISLLLLGGGAFALFKAANPKSYQAKPTEPVEANTEYPGKSILEKNNEIVAEWSKTSRQRDKLKMLEIANNANGSE